MIRPRRLAHRGTVVATGYVIDASLAGAAETRRRILQRWRRGVSVRRREDEYIVTGIAASRVRVSEAIGAPLVDQHGVLAAMPLDADEAGELTVPGAVVVTRNGVADVVQLASHRDVDLTTWIELGDFQVLDAAPLAAPPAKAVIPSPPSVDVRALTGAPAADAESNDVAAALVRARSGSGTSSVVSRFVRWVAAQLAPRQKALPEVAGESPSKLSWFDRMRGRMAAALWNSRLGMALGRRHAAYLRRMIELFDRGDLEQALRHAIPLGGEGGIGRLGIGMPRPRENLSLTFGARRTSSLIPIEDVAMEMMRDRYRAAAACLEQAGRIEEAAFVFAELLADVKGAIALLEKHGRFSIAARLGEARNVEAGLIVRLWFLAGDRERAIDTARRRQAWADAIARLERSGDERAAVLRMLWADHLAETGDFVRAVEAAWPVKESRGLVEAWIDRGIAAEGPAAARLLVKKLIVSPSNFSKVAPAMLAMLSDTDATRQRMAMVEELVGSSRTPELQTIARPALRAFVRDCGAGAPGTTSQLLEKLAKFTDDAALTTDMPAIAAAARTSALDRGATIDLQWSAHDAGALPVYDAALLPGDRLLLALGELGVRIVSRNGRTIAQIDQPATKLIVSDHGTRALALASRGQVQRIARIDLIERRGAHWCDAEMTDAASTFDGDLWLVCRGREVFAVDTTTASRWRAVWGVEVEPRDAMCTIRREGKWFAVAVRAGEELEHWYYEGFTLRSRKQAPVQESIVARPAMQATVDIGPSDAAEIVAVEVVGDYAVISRRHGDGGLVLRCLHLQAQRTVAQLWLDGTLDASIRLADSTLTIGDRRGRVIVFDLDRGVTLRDLRVS
jgi:hypothetical protein